MQNSRLFAYLLKLDVYSFNFLRISIFIVMAWIGGLKAFHYEADGIVPFVANSPLMSFFYKNAGNKVPNEDQKQVSEYTLYKNPEGKTVQKNIEWHMQNGTYVFSYGLGTMIVIIGSLVLLGIWFPKTGALGGGLTFLMSLVTLSFLVTTSEAYVPDLGGDFPTPQYGFPYLSGAGRLVIKDVIMMAAGLLLFSDSLKKVVKSPNDRNSIL
ncbi:YkgB family protein [Chryseobacterium sp. WG23]|uniref:YkgB family protein n=1 Tax=Chryseobacterium sp. WG23 TaxID=2926910 RepID=UPI00211EF237|nr:YkgB family protein [Chryseobacterium sp. WG23]MCQ9634050.1 YkgB family protein [Chryseobacterium sp. WG23]